MDKIGDEMKSNQLKELLKHIILEVTSQFQESTDYDNFDDPSNVANAIYSGLYKDPDRGGIDKDGGQIYIIMLHSPSGPRHLLKRTTNGKWFYSDSTGFDRKWKPADAHIAAKKRDRAEYAKTGKLANEMIANKDVPPDVFGAVNVEEGIFDDGPVKKKAKELFGKVKKITKISHPESNSEYFRITLTDPETYHTIRKDRQGKLSLGREEGGRLKFDQVDEESGTGAVGGYSTPFAFKATSGAGERHRKKKKKHVKEKVLPDGKYKDDMEDGRRSNRIAGMNENTFFNKLQNLARDTKMALFPLKEKDIDTLFNQFGHSNDPSMEQIKIGLKNGIKRGNVKTIQDAIKWVKLGNTNGMNEESSSGAVGQAGGVIQTPAWGTKNPLGSPKAIKGAEKVGYKVVRSITK